MSTTSQQLPNLKREDYKAVKHMDKAALTEYLSRIYMRGYKAGIEAAAPSRQTSAGETRESE
jgi:hypothetical protein